MSPRTTGTLSKSLWTGSEIADQVYIALDVRKQSPAVYLLNDDQVEESITFYSGG